MGRVVDEFESALALGVLANEELGMMTLGIVEAWFRFGQGGSGNQFVLGSGFLVTGVLGEHSETLFFRRAYFTRSEVSATVVLHNAASRVRGVRWKGECR